MPARLREVAVVLLSFIITLVGRLYRRWSALYHSLPALAPSGFRFASSSCGCTSAAHHSTSPAPVVAATTTSTQHSTAPAPVAAAAATTSAQHSTGPAASSSQSSMPPLARLPTIEALSARVIRVLGLNPGAHTLQGTNTFLVGNGKARILIDTGEGRPGYVHLLKDALKQAGAESIAAVLLTHHHYDHVGGLSQIRAAFGPSLPAHKWLLEGERRTTDNVQHIENGQVFRAEGVTLRTIYTPGHTADHAAFFLEEEASLFSGDCILGDGRTTVFDELYSYMKSLHTLKTLAETEARGMTAIYPGHGDVIRDPKTTIQGYITHRMEREAQILAVLKQHGDGGEKRGFTPLQIVHAVYEDLPVGVVASAQWNVEHHLDKLQREGKVQARLGFWQAMEKGAAVAAAVGEGAVGPDTK